MGCFATRNHSPSTTPRTDTPRICRSSDTIIRFPQRIAITTQTPVQVTTPHNTNNNKYSLPSDIASLDHPVGRSSFIHSLNSPNARARATMPPTTTQTDHSAFISSASRNGRQKGSKVATDFGRSSANSPNAAHNGHKPTMNGNGNAGSAQETAVTSAETASIDRWLTVLGYVLRMLFLDLPLAILFAVYLSCWCLETIGHEYLLPQINLMRFQSEARNFEDLTYYHRTCTKKDITATKIEQLVLPANATADEAMDHMNYHGAMLYHNLLSESTTSALREFIVEQNKIQAGWFVIENQNRYSWGIDMNMHPAFQSVFQELVANNQFITSIQKIVGPDPAIIEFTAITSSYGAADQADHQDVVPSGNAAKFGRTFVPSYSLFMPLQDTTYDMGATHVCPGSHLCSDGCHKYCFHHSLPVSGYNGSIWPRGSGALVNQQTTHKGMAHKAEGAPDRVVLIATFAPRPQTHRGVETRQIGQGGSYSLKWTHWGHTLYDFVHANQRMTEPQVQLRSLGLLKGAGYNWISQASMRIANEDNGYTGDSLEQFMEDGSLKYWPKRWQAQFADPYKETWERFAVETVELSLDGLQDLTIKAVLCVLSLVALVAWLVGKGLSRTITIVLRFSKRLFITYSIIAVLATVALKSIKETNWAKNIVNGKSYRLPSIPDVVDTGNPSTLPWQNDVLVTINYASDRLASFTRVVDATHPGNREWKSTVRQFAANSKYTRLPRALQLELSRSMIRRHQQNARFLKPNSLRQWTEILDDQALIDVAHKDLTSASSKLNDSMIRQLDALEADLIFDTWRDTAMGRVVMKGFLNALRGKLFHALTLPIKVKTNGSIMRSEATRQYATIAGLRTAAVPNRGPTRLLSIEQPRRPPFSAAWAKEGDLVEVRYECKNNELYLAIIAEMQCKDMKAVVHFLDGDHALVGRKCMRYFKPYAFGETVNVRLQDGSNTWHAAQFLESVKSSNSTLRPVRVRTDAGDIVRVEPRNIRRILDDTEDDDNGDDDDDEEGDDDEYDGEDAGETYFLSIDEDYNSRRANDDDEDE